MKKIAALFLSLAMVLSLAACGQTPSAPVEDTPTDPVAPVEPVGETADTASDTYDGIFDASVNPGSQQDVVYVKGSWFDMGRQYALQQSAQLENNWVSLMTLLLSEDDPDQIYRSFRNTYEYLKNNDSNAAEFIAGVADGAQVSIEDATATVLQIMMLDPNTLEYSEGDRSNTCMTVSAWGNITEDGHLITGANLDSESTNACAMFSQMVSYPDDGYAVIATGGLRGNAFMNSNGVSITYSGGAYTAPAEGDEVLEREGICLDRLFGFWYACSVCGTAKEAVEFLTQGHWINTGNVNISDPSGDAYLLEQADYATQIRKAGDHGETDYILSSNEFLSEYWLNEYYDTYDDCVARYSTVEKLILDDSGKFGPKQLAEAFGSIRYYLDGKWSGENWDYPGERQFFSPEGDDGYFKTSIRTVMDATEQTVY